MSLQSALASEPVGPRHLIIYNWSDYVAPGTLSQFEAETGIQTLYRTYDSNQGLEASLLAGAPADLIFPSAQPLGAALVRGGLLQPLNRGLLGNYANLDLPSLAELAEVDPENRHLIPYLWGTTGLGYNIGKIEEIFDGEAPIDSWTLLFDPQNSARLSGCGIAVLDDETEGLSAALIYLGLPLDTGQPEHLRAVVSLWSQVSPHVRYFNSSRYLDDLAQGRICLALGYSGDILQARDRAERASSGVEIEYAIPNEGALRWIDTVAIPASATNVEEAHQFIDFLLRPEVIAEISNHVEYANANPRSEALLRPQLREDPAIYPSAERMATLSASIAPRAVDKRRRSRAWRRIKSSR